jgi:hypothetical protein
MADYNPNAATPNTTKPTPNPQSAMLFFFLITTVYCIISIFMSGSDASQKVTVKVCYVLFIITGEYFINLNLADAMCGVKQWQAVLFITFVPWLLIFVTLHMFLIIFPGWLSPFSNTFGYLVVKLMGLPELMKNIVAEETDDATGTTKRALLSVTNDDSLVINQFSPEPVTETVGKDGTISKNHPIFDTAWANLQAAGILKKFTGEVEKNNMYRDKLYEFVEMKYTISEFIWNLLTGFLVTTVSYNYIVNIGCKKSAADMKKLHDEYEASEKKKIADDAAFQANQPKYQ